MPTPIQARYQGVFPVVPTTFTPSGALDLPSQLRCVDFMIDAGSTGRAPLAHPAATGGAPLELDRALGRGAFRGREQVRQLAVTQRGGFFDLTHCGAFSRSLS